MIYKQRAVEGEQIEHKETHRLFGARLLDVARASKPAHHFLERDRTAVRVDRDDLAVEDRVARIEVARNLDDLRQARSDLVHAAGENSHRLRVDIMNLHSGAVDLVLE